jgi:hypothetical protein
VSGPAIIPLLKQFRAGQLTGAELQAQLETILQQCERKRESLKQLQIVPADRAEWERFLLPALDLSYQALIGAAQLGQAYAGNPSQDIAEAIVYAFVQVDKATTFVEQRLGAVSAETRQTLAGELNALDADVSAVKTLSAGHAQSAISLFND